MAELCEEQPPAKPVEYIRIQHYLCKCGVHYTENNLPMHLKHYRHRMYMKQQEEQNEQPLD